MRKGTDGKGSLSKWTYFAKMGKQSDGLQKTRVEKEENDKRVMNKVIGNVEEKGHLSEDCTGHMQRIRAQTLLLFMASTKYWALLIEGRRVICALHCFGSWGGGVPHFYFLKLFISQVQTKCRQFYFIL